jgi:hypothetical protein
MHWNINVDGEKPFLIKSGFTHKSEMDFIKNSNWFRGRYYIKNYYLSILK